MGVVLIAFERESEQSAIDQLLSNRGHRVLRSPNGLTALDAARREPPDLIVSDIVLPRMDGFALCRKWKQDERLQSIPFIFYTRRHDDPKYERFALELGAERFLAKSVAPETLATAVDELLTHSPARANTAPMPALDEERIARERARERVAQRHARAAEQLEQAQAQLRTRIAELEANHQRLLSSETRFRALFETNPLPMWIVDHETGAPIAVNEAALRSLGYTRAEFLALRSEQLRAGGTSQATSIAALTRKDGLPVMLARSSMAIEFDGRSADAVCAYDVTQFLAQEQAALQQAASARALFDAAPDGMWIVEGDGQIVDVNPAYCRMSGYDKAALLKMRVAQIEDPSSGDTTTRLQLSRNAAADSYESKHRRADGSFLDVEVSIGALQQGRGDTLMVIRDVSKRRRELAVQKSRQRQLEFLVELFKQAETFDESAIVRRVLDFACELVNSPLSYLYFVDEEQNTIQLAAWRERSQSHATMASSEARPLARSSLFTECVRAKRPTSSNDLARKPQSDGLPELQRYLAVPLIDGERAVAVLGVANRDAGYGEEDQRALTALAEGVWRVLHAKRAHAQTLGSLQRTDVALQGMIDAFVRMIERHDPYTAGSSRRLAALAVALAREAGLDGERQHGLRIAALLHDIGNIAVPASILAKPAPLTEAELALMRTHVEEGCQMLAEIDFGAPVADIIYQHHERYDGSGYPRGLKGEEIMIEARILAIADTVEAMCSPRPYRAVLGMEAAIDEINRSAGRLYDLHLVTACTRLVRQHGFVLPE